MAEKIKTRTRVRVIGSSVFAGRTGTIGKKPTGYAMPTGNHYFVNADAGETDTPAGVRVSWPAGLIGPISADHLEIDA
jgi:hypothetical protein